jgi:hypothetical protein
MCANTLTINHQPSTINHQPLTINHQPLITPSSGRRFEAHPKEP